MKFMKRIKTYFCEMQTPCHKLLLSAFLLLILVSACNGPSTPKPKGYFKITLPEKQYIMYAPKDCPYRFEIPVYTTAYVDNTRFKENCWVNIEYPQFHAKLHISYKDV